MLYIQVDITFAICAVYLVDVMQSRSSEVLAAIKYVLSFHWPFKIQGLKELLISLMCAVLAAMTVAITLPMIDAYGAAVMYLLCAVLIWISYGYVVVPERKEKGSLIMTTDSVLCYIIKYGDKMRAGINIGFSAVENSSKLVHGEP
jgi:hypothetical protein